MIPTPSTPSLIAAKKVLCAFDKMCGPYGQISFNRVLETFVLSDHHVSIVSLPMVLFFFSKFWERICNILPFLSSLAASLVSYSFFLFVIYM